jgi:hypothetical protein
MVNPDPIDHKLFLFIHAMRRQRHQLDEPETIAPHQ